MKSVVIIKNKLDAQNNAITAKNLKKASESLAQDVVKDYDCRLKDATGFYEDENSKSKRKYHFVMLVNYRGEGKVYTDNRLEKTQIESIYIGKIENVELTEKDNQNKCKIYYKMKKCIQNKRVIINLLDGIDLNINDDYGDYSYVMVRSVESFTKTIEDMLITPILPQGNKLYEEMKETYELAEYAQKNSMCKRMYGLHEPDANRSEFQRDRERIVNSKAFRRLVDKAQIFSAEKGDHYRTRMTHTLEVNQIAKAISYGLRLNMDLTEAIALAHDIGHTPFGHQGERTIRDILDGKELAGLFCVELKDDKSDVNLFGGFKHNFQGVRVLTKLEEKYVDYPGLDISFQVLEGVLKHTKLKDAELKEFISQEFADRLHIENSFCTNLEGQVVTIADEIAQRGHDIDDAITSGLIDIDELLDCLDAYKFQKLHEKLKNERKNIRRKKRHYVSERELVIGRIISCIVGYFINDVIKTSSEEMKEYGNVPADGVFDKELIVFSKEGKDCCNFLEKLINKRVIANSDVTRFDHNAGMVIKKLFENYYKNPRLLHAGTLRKIYIDTLTSKVDGVAESAIDLLNGNIDISRQEIKEITTTLIEDINVAEQAILLEKRKILVRNIADYIAGMTDSYALNEYEKLR